MRIKAAIHKHVYIRGGFKGGGAQGARAPLLTEILLLAAIIRNTLIEQSPTLMKQSLTNTGFLIMPMLNFQ